VFAALLALVGLALLVDALPRLWRGNPETQWPPVQGLITRADVRPTGDSNYHDVLVNYSYRYADRELTGNQITPLGFSHRSREAAEEALASYGYAVGSPVTVFVNPRKPHHSVLKPGRQTWRALWVSLWASVCLVWAYFIAVQAWTPK